MSDAIKKQLNDAIQKAKNWAKVGWQVTFGPHGYEVNSITQANALPREFPYRQEAVGYWKNVEGLSIEVTKYLEGALKAVEQGNRKEAEDKLYFAQYYERPIERNSMTSKPMYDSFMKQ